MQIDFCVLAFGFSLYQYKHKDMTIQQLIDKVKVIVQEKLQINTFYIGNNFDMSAGKGDNYPCVWFEMPVLVNYNNKCKHSKEYTFSMDFLTLPEYDDTTDEINMISHMESYADGFLQHLKMDLDFSLVDFPNGLTVKSMNADKACGIRLDIKVNTGRICVDCLEHPETC